MCLITLNSCVIQIHTPNAPSPSAAIQETPLTNTEYTPVMPSNTPDPTPVVANAPSKFPMPSQSKLRVQQEIDSICTELGILDSPVGPAQCESIFSTNHISYNCANGTFYATYHDNLTRKACFYLENNAVNGFDIHTIRSFSSGWIVLSEVISAESIPSGCLPIPGYPVDSKANLLFLLSKDDTIEKTYAIPYTQTKDDHYLMPPQVINDLLFIYMDDSNGILFNPNIGAIIDTQGIPTNSILAVNEDRILSQISVTEDGKRHILCFDHAGQQLCELTASTWLSINTAQDGTIYMTRGAGEKDFLIDIHSYPVYILSDEMTFEEILPENALYDKVHTELQPYEQEGIRIQITSLNAALLSASECKVLCGISIFDDDTVLCLDGYVLFNLDI